MKKSRAQKEPANDEILTFRLGGKSVIWLAETNDYILAEPLAAEILMKIRGGFSRDSIVAAYSLAYNLSEEELKPVVQKIMEGLEDIQRRKRLPGKKEKRRLNANFIAFSRKYYLINKIVICAEYQSEKAEQLNHPKFAHLETKSTGNFHHLFRVLDDGENLSLVVDGKTAGIWPAAESHFLGGKFSMQVIQKIYDMEEDRWMGVFHAAGISSGGQCMMFYGDSGNGKSTLSALLMAAGLDVLSDDFLPVESSTGLVYRFPAALSVKKQAYDLLLPEFPELKDAEEYVNPAMQKTFRYLVPKNKSLTGVKCIALVFVKFNQSVDFLMEEMEAEEAFTKLVPDSWIHPSAQNARNFMTWFSRMKYYRLVYSDNARMIATIRDMLNIQA